MSSCSSAVLHSRIRTMSLVLICAAPARAVDGEPAADSRFVDLRGTKSAKEEGREVVPSLSQSGVGQKLLAGKRKVVVKGEAAIGAGLDTKDRGRGAATGALIGAGVGAAAGTLYGISR